MFSDINDEYEYQLNQKIKRLQARVQELEAEKESYRVKLLILAKHIAGYPQDILAAPKIVALDILKELQQK